MTTIRIIQPAQWELHRELRLAALLEAPDAFGSTYEAEVGRTPAQWKARLEEAAQSGTDLPLAAFVDDEPAGLTWARANPTRSIVNVYQMWVVPRFRGMGVGSALLARAVEWATELRVAAIDLGVTIGQSSARRMYERNGFVAIGEPEPLREGSALRAQNMRRSIQRSTA